MNFAVKNRTLQARPIYHRDDPVKAAELIEGCDMVFMARAADPMLLEAIAAYRKIGKKLIIDYDDNMFECSPLSPHYVDLGTENVRYEVDGKIVPLWIDGKKDFDIKRNKERLDVIKTICSQADAITVTTDRLADVFRPWSKQVHILPNCVDLSVWKKLPLIRNEKEIRMGWGGGASHYEDWMEIAPVLPEIIKKYPNLKIVISGHKFGAAFKNIPEDRVEFHSWVHLEAHPYKQASLDLDFAVIPLKDSIFNAGKSTIKWVEYASLHVPSVTSNVAPYDQVADIVKDNGIFVDNSFESWMTGLSLMIEGSEARKSMGDNAYQTVVEHFDISTQYPLWPSAFNQTMAFEPRKEGVLV